MNRGPYHWTRHCVSFFDEKPGCCGLIYGFEGNSEKTHSDGSSHRSGNRLLNPDAAASQKIESGKFTAPRLRANHDGDQSPASLHRIQLHQDGLTVEMEGSKRRGVVPGYAESKLQHCFILMPWDGKRQHPLDRYQSSFSAYSSIYFVQPIDVTTLVQLADKVIIDKACRVNAFLRSQDRLNPFR